MSDQAGSLRRGAAVGLLLAGAAAALAPGGPAGRAAVLAEGCDLASTADPEQARSIRALLAAGRAARTPAAIEVDYPLAASLFPPEIAPPTFVWHDAAPRADGWLVDVAFAASPARIRVLVPRRRMPEGRIDPRCIAVTNEIYRPTPYQASAWTWKPAPDVWAAIKEHSVAGPATVTWLGFRHDAPGEVLSRGRTTFSTSVDPVGAPIFYRDVPLMPSATEDGVIKPLDQSAQPLIGWRLRDISREESRLLLENMPTCANCHSFSADGKTLAMDVDGPSGDKGAYAIAPIEPRMKIRDEHVFTWNAFPGKPPGHHTLGFLSRISPDGRHVVSTVNEAIYVQNFTDHRFSQVFYPTRGILAYYSRDDGSIRALPGADDPAYVHCDGVWTPDGKTLVFARAEARDPYIRGRPAATYAGDPNETPIQYDLYRIPFNGGRGGRAEPIRGASQNGMSNTFPKVSPDGKWIVFVQCRNGQLMRPDSKLWIVPVEGGEARPLSCNLPLMNSWHSFSPNGRWLVFSSKSNTPYTQMFLTHLDEDGNDSPAILIENSTAANRAVNLPEFVNVAYDRLVDIDVQAVDHYPHFRRGNRLAQDGRHEQAVAEFEKALAGGPQDWRYNDWRIHENLSKSLLRLGRTERALAHIEESLRLNPYNAEMRTNLGYLLAERGDRLQALEQLDMVVRLYPRQSRHWYNRATLHLRMGDRAAALADYTEAIRLDPGYTDAFNGRGAVRLADGDLEGAARDFDEAVRLDPSAPTAWYFRAQVRERLGDRPGALSDLDRALEAASPAPARRAEIEDFRRRLLASGAGGE